MKNRLIIFLSNKYRLLFILYFSLLLSCNKDVYESIKVETVAVSQIGEDSILVEGRISNNNNVDVLYNGFCMSKLPFPEMKDNQVLVKRINGSFKALYLNLEPDTEYYFRSFAVNDFEYTYGNIIKFKVPY